MHKSFVSTFVLIVAPSNDCFLFAVGLFMHSYPAYGILHGLIFCGAYIEGGTYIVGYPFVAVSLDNNLLG